MRLGLRVAVVMLLAGLLTGCSTVYKYAPGLADRGSATVYATVSPNSHEFDDQYTIKTAIYERITSVRDIIVTPQDDVFDSKRAIFVPVHEYEITYEENATSFEGVQRETRMIFERAGYNVSWD